MRRAGAKFEVKNILCENPVKTAIKRGSQAMLQILVDERFSLRSVPGGLIHTAIEARQNSMIPFLIQLGGRTFLEAENEQGLRPLHYAARQQNLEAAQALLSLSAESKSRVTREQCSVCARLSLTARGGMIPRCVLNGIKKEDRTKDWQELDELLRQAEGWPHSYHGVDSR